MVKEWIPFVTGILMISLGLGYFFSPWFGQFAYKGTTQGVFWKWLVGERFTPLLTKYFFSIVSILAGVWFVYSGVAGWDAFKVR